MRIGFLGGDARMRIPMEALGQRGYSIASLAPLGIGVATLDTAALCAFADVLVFPVPASKDGATLSGTGIPFSHLPVGAHHAVFGGFFPKDWQLKAHRVFDCALDEPFVLKNAALTADGGICAALSATERGFYGCSAAVIGHGRIARMLIRRLLGFGVPITVYARRPEALADAALLGCRAVPLQLDTVISEDILFNTVPAPVFDGVRAAHPVAVFDLGGGLPNALLSPSGDSIPVTSMRGVPGVFAPRAAGEIILDALLSFLNSL